MIAFCERKPTFPGNWLAKGSCLNFYYESPKFLSKVGLQIKINVKTSHPQHTHIFKLEGNHYQGREFFVFFLFGFIYCCITSTFHRADIQQLFVDRMDQILLLTVLLTESLNIFLYVCPPTLTHLECFLSLLKAYVDRHMVNENGGKDT